MFSRGGLNLRHALHLGAVHVHGLATAGAMLTCFAFVVNAVPYAKVPASGLPGNTVVDTVRVTEPRMGLASIAGPDIARTQTERPASATEAADVIAHLASWSGPPPTPVIEVASSPTPKGAGAEALAQSPDAVAQPHGDPAGSHAVKRDAIVGIWAPDAATCSARDFQDGVLPAVINIDGAWAGETSCVFQDKKQTETGWRVVAKCSNPRERWTANVRLTVNGNRLTWTSRRGSQTYTRCPSDVLMAKAG
jgi:hypothetical protein